MADTTDTLDDIARSPRRGLRAVGGTLAAIVVLAAIYFVGGMVWMHRIEADLQFGTNLEVPAGASRAVAVTSALVDREVNQNRWLPNDPPFLPSHFLDNAPNFQRGMIEALARFSVELNDEIGRVRGSSAADADLGNAAGRLQYPADIWIFEWSSAPVQPSSESQYRRAVEDLRRYNQRLASGEAVFERRSDNLRATLDRIAADMGAVSASIADKVDRDTARWIDFTADDVFYRNKGRMYAYYMVLRELGRDYEALIRERTLAASWAQMLDSLDAAAGLQPWVVMNGQLDSLATPNHLAAQGFEVLRARTQLREITSILLN